MRTLTAIIKSKPGGEARVRQALMDVAVSVKADEPGTISYFVTQDPKTPTVFTTHERFADDAAMRLHNDGPASKGFFAVAKDLLDGDVAFVIGDEIAAVNR